MRLPDDRDQAYVEDGHPTILSWRGFGNFREDYHYKENISTKEVYTKVLFPFIQYLQKQHQKGTIRKKRKRRK